MSVLAKRYARALFEVAESKGAVDAVAADLAALAATLDDSEARAAVVSPEVPAAVRGKVFAKLAEGRHDLTRNFLNVLDGRKRHELLPDVPAAFAILVRASRGEVEGVVEAPHAPDDAQLAQLSALASKLSGQRVDLRFEHKPELIGGVRLRVGNTLYDGSVVSQLESLKSRLMGASI